MRSGDRFCGARPRTGKDDERFGGDEERVGSSGSALGIGGGGIGGIFVPSGKGARVVGGARSIGPGMRRRFSAHVDCCSVSVLAFDEVADFGGKACRDAAAAAAAAEPADDAGMLFDFKGGGLATFFSAFEGWSSDSSADFGGREMGGNFLAPLLPGFSGDV